jgi:hypothetical protein
VTTTAGLSSSAATTLVATQVSTLTATGFSSLAGLSVSGSASFASTLSADGIISAAGLISTGTVTAGGVALTSDRRYKDDISPLKKSLETVLKLQGVSYVWKRDEFPERHFDSATQYGFIAQEVEEVIPEVVGTDEKGWKSVFYHGFTPLLVEAVKEQQGSIVELKDEVENIKLRADEASKNLENVKNLLDSANQSIKQQSVLIDEQGEMIKALMARNAELASMLMSTRKVMEEGEERGGGGNSKSGNIYQATGGTLILIMGGVAAIVSGIVGTMFLMLFRREQQQRG